MKKYSLLTSFLPWFVYWVGLSLGQLKLSLGLALLISLFLSFKELRQGKIKDLSLGALLFFLIMFLIISLTKPFWLWHEISLMGNLALALITLLTIIIKRPFTLQYAMESAPKERWASPNFIHGNYVITWGWFFVFVIMAFPSLGELRGISSPLWFHWGYSFICFIGGMIFTNWYTKISRAKS